MTLTTTRCTLLIYRTRTTDARIAEVANDGSRILVTKERDFRDGHLLVAAPPGCWLLRPETSPTPRC